MATQVEELQLELTAKIDKLVTNLNKVDKRVKKTAKQAEDSNKKMQGAFRETAAAVAAFQGPLGPVAGRINALGAAVGRAGPIITLMGVGVAGLTIALKKSINAAAEYNREVMRLEGITQATGYAAGISAASINKFAKDLGEATLTSASAAREAAGIIATFKSITGDTFKDTLRLAQDMSEAGFGSLRQTALQLSKALEEPVEGINALRRSGVSFTQAQKDMIKGFVESGEKAKAQAEIIRVVNGQVGGTGVAAAQGLAGAMDTLGERVQRVWEFIGNTLPVEAAAKAINFLSDTIADLLEETEDMEDGTKLFNEVLKANEAVLKKNGIEIQKFANQSGTVIRSFMEGMKNQGLDLEENLKFSRLQSNVIKTTEQIKSWELAMNSARKAGDAYSENKIGNKIAELESLLIEQTVALRDSATAHLEEKLALEESASAKERMKRILEEDKKLRREVTQAEKEFAAMTKESAEALDPMGAILDEFIAKEERLNEISQMLNLTREQRMQIEKHLAQQQTEAISKLEEQAAKEEEAAAAKAQQEKEKAEERIQALQDSWGDEFDALDQKLRDENMLIAEALEARAITEAQAQEMSNKSLTEYWKARDKITRQRTIGELKNWGSFFQTMMSLSNSQSKSLFKVFKALNLATAITSTFAAVNKAMAEVPWPANIAAAASALAAGLANVASIKSTNFEGGGGGGGGATPAAGGAGTATPTAAPPTEVSQPQTVTDGGRTGPGTVVNLNIGDDALIGKEGVRSLIDQINEQIQDGASIQSIQVS